MIIIYRFVDNVLNSLVVKKHQDLVMDGIFWIDLINPTLREEALLKNTLDISISHQSEVYEITISNCIYVDEGVHYLKINMLSHEESGYENIDSEPVNFIIKGNCLITIRPSQSRTFSSLVKKMQKFPLHSWAPGTIFMTLLQSYIYYAADVLEYAGRILDLCTRTIFHERSSLSYEGEASAKPNFAALLANLGLAGLAIDKIRGSLLSFNCFSNHVCARSIELPDFSKEALNILIMDASALNEYLLFLSSKLNFNLEAVLGMVHIEQNNTIRTFSIVAVIFLPPTLIASIYGMNFRFMPELSWNLGYPLAIFLMLISMLIPLACLRWKKLL